MPIVFYNFLPNVREELTAKQIFLVKLQTVGLNFLNCFRAANLIITADLLLNNIFALFEPYVGIKMFRKRFKLFKTVCLRRGEKIVNLFYNW